MNARKKLGLQMGVLSRRERVILLVLLTLLLVYAGDFLVGRLYLQPRRELAEAVAQAEEQVRHNRRLLSRAEHIHGQFKKLGDPVTVARDSVLTETEVLRQLSSLAGTGIHVQSMVPRVGSHDGRQVMFVALDFEGPFPGVVKYVSTMLDEIPSEVSRLSLAPRQGGEKGVVCRLSLRVDCLEP